MLLAAALGLLAPQPPGPRIAVEPGEFDFGRALQQRTLRRDFTLRNFGDRELVIASVSTSCGCAAALLDDMRLRPGGRARLRVSLETGADVGRVERSVVIRSNDPERGLLELKLRVRVVPPR